MINLYHLRHYITIAAMLAALNLLSFQGTAQALQVSSNITPEEMVQDILIGGGVVTSNITYTGNNISRGKFWGGPGSIGIEEGIILTSGGVNIASGPNNAPGAGTNSGEGGDPDLTMISGVTTFDACVLEFDFIPQSNTVSFKYVFGSEEYHEYVNQFNDAFGFFISGPGIDGPFSNNSANIALIPLSDIPVTINNVNCGNPYNCTDNCENCVFFVNNPQGQQFTQYDAFTTVLRAWANVIPCETYHIKLAIGDGLDHAYDSGVFLEANSFSSVGIESEAEFSQPSLEFAVEGCSDVSIMFTLSIQPDADFYLPLVISGTAVNGIDYEEIPDSLLFLQGHSQSSLDIVTLADPIAEWFENIRIVYNSSLCSIDFDTILITLRDYQLDLNMTPDTAINCATQASIGVASINGLEPYSYVWSTGDTTPYITVSPLISTTYYVTVSALCDSSTTDSVLVNVNGPESGAGMDQSIPYGTTTILEGSAGQGSGNYTFSWEPAELLVDPFSATPVTLQLEQTTQFTLIVTDLAGGCQDLDQMIVFVTGGPLNVGPVANPGAICPGESSQLYSYASGGSENYTYSWSSVPPGFSSDLQNPLVMPTESTTYFVMINDGYNTVNGDVAVEVNDVPIPEAGENDTIFHGTIGKLYGSATQGTGSYSWSWEPTAKLQNPTAQNPTTYKLYETTLFRLTVTDNNTGCVSASEDLVTVVVNGGPLAVTAEITDPLICGGGTTQLHALPSGGNPEYTYNWTSDPPGFTSNESEPLVTPFQSTTYSVEVYDGFNYIQAEVSVTVSVPPVVSLGTDIIACPLDTVYLSVNYDEGLSYYWSNGSVEPYITIGTTGIGFDLKTIWVEVKNEVGCMGTDTIRVVFDFAQCSGVGDNEENTYLYIYPNPTTGKVAIEWKGLAGMVDMQITDLQGNRVLDQAIQSLSSGDYEGTISLDGQPKGIYLLRLVGENNVLVRKILLQ